MASPSCQVVDGEAEFNEPGVQDFFSAVKMDHVGRDYQVVAIMGPQSSGKSTLLNAVVSGDAHAVVGAARWRARRASFGVRPGRRQRVDTPERTQAVDPASIPAGRAPQRSLRLMFGAFARGSGIGARLS